MPPKKNADDEIDLHESDEEEVVESEEEEEQGEDEEVDNDDAVVNDEDELEFYVNADDEPIEHDTQMTKHFKVVDPEERVTSDRLSLFECARMIGEYAKHLDNGAQTTSDIQNCTSSLEIAYRDLLAKKIPMAVIRHVGQNKVEVWKLKEMILPDLPPLSYFM